MPVIEIFSRSNSEMCNYPSFGAHAVALPEQYFGVWTPQTVKDRVTEVLYGWTLWLKDQPKIKEAYSMLKKQGVCFL